MTYFFDQTEYEARRIRDVTLVEIAIYVCYMVVQTSQVKMTKTAVTK
jgi:hypothetical protein